MNSRKFCGGVVNFSYFNISEGSLFMFFTFILLDRPCVANLFFAYNLIKFIFIISFYNLKILLVIASFMSNSTVYVTVNPQNQ